MLKSSTESERGLYPLWIILSVGFETDIDLLFVSLFVLQCPLGPQVKSIGGASPGVDSMGTL